MRRNDQTLYRDHAGTLYENPKIFQSMLRAQVAARMEYFDRVSPNWANLEVLDLGCGGGYMSETLARRGARVTGIDPCAEGLRVAIEHARREGLHITYREGAGEEIPLPSGCMDRVVCVDVLEHVEDVARVIAECRRVLRTGGIFFFDTINRSALAAFLMVTLAEDVLRFIPRGAHDPSRFIRPGDLRRLLERAGFDSVGEFSGMGMVLRSNLRIAFTVTRSTAVVYLGHATAASFFAAHG